MKDYLCIFPYCIVRSNRKEVLIYNPDTKEHVLSDVLKQESSDMLCNSYYMEFNEDVREFSEEVCSKGLGYVINGLAVPPYIQVPHISFVSSLAKEKKSFGHNTGWHTPSLLRRLTIMLNNTLSLSGIDTQALSLQAGYPQISVSKPAKMCSKVVSELKKTLDGASNLEMVTLCGELDDTMEEMVALLITKVPVTVRTYTMDLKALHFLLDKHPALNVEILLNRKNYGNFVEPIEAIKDRVLFTVLLESLSEMRLWDSLDLYLSYRPLIRDKNAQADMIRQMLLTKEEILQTHDSLFECLCKDVINTSMFGEATVEITGNVSLCEKHLGNLKDDNLFALLTKGLENKDNAWMFTRNKSKNCQSCIFCNLCPNISMYERIGTLTTACIDVEAI